MMRDTLTNVEQLLQDQILKNKQTESLLSSEVDKLKERLSKGG